MIGSRRSACDAARPPTEGALRPGLQRALLGSLTLLLATAVVLQLLPYPSTAIVQRDAPLADYFPNDVADWRGEDRPLAGTEALAGAVKRTLDYDEAMLRFYRKGAQEFSVYVAYWRAGKTPSRDVAFHIPDKCWTSVGWKRCAADYHYQRKFAGRQLAPAQYREFEESGERQYVIYWHIFNGRAIIYNPDGSPSDLSILTDLLHRGLRQKGEQYFIRVASRIPIDQLWNDRGFQQILGLIAPLGPGLHSDVEQFEPSR